MWVALKLILTRLSYFSQSDLQIVCHHFFEVGHEIVVVFSVYVLGSVFDDWFWFLCVVHVIVT